MTKSIIYCIMALTSLNFCTYSMDHDSIEKSDPGETKINILKPRIDTVIPDGEEQPILQMYQQIMDSNPFLECDNISECLKPLLIKKIKEAHTNVLEKSNLDENDPKAFSPVKLNIQEILQNALQEAFAEKDTTIEQKEILANVFQKEAKLGQRNTKLAALANVATAALVGAIWVAYHFLSESDCKS